NIYTYDAIGRMKSVIQAAQSGGQAVSPKRVDLSYTADGQLDEINRWANTTTTNWVGESTFEFDAGGRLTQIAHAGANSHYNEVFDYLYDHTNRLTHFASAIDDIDIEYNYDSRGQLTSVTDGNSAFDETYAYDGNGNRISSGHWWAENIDYATGDQNRLLEFN